MLTFRVSKMGKPSREEDILKLFYEEPSRHWHFSKIKEKVPIADNKISKWLKIFQKENLIQKSTPPKKMPYYLSNYENPEYQNRKRLYALQTFHNSGFLNHLASLKKAKTVILFGSYSRWDWHKDSDIDLFIFGDDSELEQGKYEFILNKEIQLFRCKTKKDLKRYHQGLLKNIIKGDLIKGDLNFLEVKAYA